MALFLALASLCLQALALDWRLVTLLPSLIACCIFLQREVAKMALLDDRETTVIELRQEKSCLCDIVILNRFSSTQLNRTVELS